jgi:hypothetical protein
MYCHVGEHIVHIGLHFAKDVQIGKCSFEILSTLKSAYWMQTVMPIFLNYEMHYIVKNQSPVMHTGHAI